MSCLMVLQLFRVLSAPPFIVGLCVVLRIPLALLSVFSNLDLYLSMSKHDFLPPRSECDSISLVSLCLIIHSPRRCGM